MKPVIVTRISGAGKIITLKILEDLSFHCVGNPPISLMDEFTQLAAVGNNISQVALGIDIRSGEGLSQLGATFRGWKELGMGYQILFLDVNDRVLIKRYKEARCGHPLAGTNRLDKGIEKERVKLTFLKKDTGFIIDTSKLLVRELRQKLEKIFLKHQKYCNMFVTVLPFDSKYRILEDTDLALDMRFPSNPYYVEELRPPTEGDQSIRDYVMQGGTYTRFLDKLYDMMDFLLSNYINEGKNQLVVMVGCTEGKHRSVMAARALCSHLTAKIEYGIKIEYRDTDKDNKRR